MLLNVCADFTLSVIGLARELYLGTLCVEDKKM